MQANRRRPLLGVAEDGGRRELKLLDGSYWTKAGMLFDSSATAATPAMNTNVSNTSTTAAAKPLCQP